MLFPPDSIGCYLDFRTQEIAIAAALSGDEAMRRDYLTGDFYHAMCFRGGFTTESDRKRWKKENDEQRSQMKQLQLGINYGMGVPSLARGLNRHPCVASDFIEKHKRWYPRFWEWREEVMHDALLDRRIESVFGWPLRLSTSPNLRTLFNFPMQSAGSEMLRLATVRLCEADIVPVMLVHDAVLLEVDDHAKIEEAKAIMLAAGREVCSGLEVGVDSDPPLIGGARYIDKRPMAKKMWATIMGTLRDIGALPEAMAS
jgi:DNA polymerase I-like protein with 3'-5' exonuclease and polymerase domains